MIRRIISKHQTNPISLSSVKSDAGIDDQGPAVFSIFSHLDTFAIGHFVDLFLIPSFKPIYLSKSQTASFVAQLREFCRTELLVIECTCTSTS